MSSINDTYAVTFKGFTPVGGHTSNNALTAVVTLTPPVGAQDWHYIPSRIRWQSGRLRSDDQ